MMARDGVTIWCVMTARGKFTQIDQLRAWAIRVDWGMGLDDGFEISMWRHFGH